MICPDNIKADLPKNLSTVSVTWSAATATHLGQPVTADLSTGPSSPAVLQQGTYRVVYEAHNPYGGATGYCEFHITVSGIAEF